MPTSPKSVVIDGSVIPAYQMMLEAEPALSGHGKLGSTLIVILPGVISLV